MDARAAREGPQGPDRGPLDTRRSPLSGRLKTYIRYERPKSADRALFLTQRSGGGGFVGLTAGAVKSMMRRLSLETGLNVHAHALRHTFATRAIAAGVNPMVLQRVLGHTTMRMSMHYVHMQGTDILQTWARRRD